MQGGHGRKRRQGGERGHRGKRGRGLEAGRTWWRGCWIRRPGVGRLRAPARRWIHHDGRRQGRRSVSFYFGVALGAEAIEFHLPLRRLQARILVVAGAAGAAGGHIEVAPRARAFGGACVGLRRGLGRSGARGLFALALGLALGLQLLGGGFDVQALLFFCQRLGGLGALLGNFFGGLACLHFACAGARIAITIGVGDGAGARVGAAHHLGGRGQAQQACCRQDEQA